MLIQPLTPEILEKRRAFRRKIFGTLGRVSRKTGGGLRRVWRKTRRGLFWTLVIGFVAHSALNIYASALLNRELAAIRQKGEPLQFAEMAPSAVPDSQNAALIYAQASKALQLSAAEKLVFNTRESDRTPEQQKTLEAALLKNQKTLDLTRRAASMRQCLFPLNYAIDNPSGLLFPHYGEMHDLARLMAANVSFEVKNGDHDAALRDVRSIFEMARHLSNEPVLIGFLVAQTVDALANQALAKTLDDAPLTAAQARAFEASLPNVDWGHAYHHCLMGERSWGTLYIEKMGQSNMAHSWSQWDENSPPLWAAYPLLLLWRPMMKLDEVQMLRLWRLQLDSPIYQQIPRPANPATSIEVELTKVPVYAVLTRILMPVFARASDNRDFCEVRRRQRVVAIELAAYRTSKGHYPAHLQEAAASWGKPLPLDPYSNKPFLYHREGNSFLLYSVGVNRADNNGSGPWFNVNHRKPGDDDLVWRNSLH